MKGKKLRSNDVQMAGKTRLLNESLIIVERLKKMRAAGIAPKNIRIDPRIRNLSWLQK